MTESAVVWVVIGVLAGLAGAVMSRRYFGPRRAQKLPPQRPPASRQERRKRERQAEKHGR
jgi:H+/Cl- antiporter ClcA